MAIKYFLQFIFLSNADIGAAPVDKESLRCCLVLSLLPQSKPEMIFKDWREVVIDWDHSLSHLGSEILNNSLQFQSNRSSLYNFLEEFADFMQNMELLIPTTLQNLGKNIPSRRYWKKDPWKIKGNGKWVYRMLKICLTFNKNIQNLTRNIIHWLTQTDVPRVKKCIDKVSRDNKDRSCSNKHRIYICFCQKC